MNKAKLVSQKTPEQFIQEDIIRRRQSTQLEKQIIEDHILAIKEEKSESDYNYDSALSSTGFGIYQLGFYLVMVVLGMGEGSQISVFTLMIPILKEEWGVPDSLNSLSASVVFVGCLIGSLFSGQFADKIGRKQPFIFSTGIASILTLMTAFTQNIYQLIVLRGSIGILVGFFGPLGVTYTSEFTPTHSRGRFMSIIQISIAFGQLYGLFMGYLTLNEDLQSGNWRHLSVCCSIPAVLSWLGGYFFLDESALFCLANKKYDQCFEILTRINKINGHQIVKDISKENKEQLIKWSQKTHKKQDSEQGSVKQLIEGKLKKLTIIVWVNWFTLSFVYYGIIVMMPFMLSKMPQNQNNSFSNNNITLLTVQGISDMVGASIASYLIEIPGMGRKNSMIIFFILSGFISVLVYYNQGENFAILALLDRFFLSLTFVFAYQYTSEIYPTSLRTTGVGIANSIGRIGGTIIPFISMYLSEINLFAPFILYSIIAFATALFDTQIEYDTLGKQLDSE